MLRLLLVMMSVMSAFAVEPDRLEPNWWEQFLQEPGNLEEKGQKLDRQLQAVYNTLSEGKQAEAKEWAVKVQNHLKTLNRTLKSTPPSLPPVLPLAESYTLDQMVEIHRKMRNGALELKSLKDERADKLSALDALQDQLDRIAKGYFKNSPRSEDKLVNGLKLMATELALLNVKEELTRLETQIVSFEGYLKRLKELELSAKKRIVLPLEGPQTEQLKAHWQASEKELRQKESEPVLTGVRGQLRDQEIVQFQISELLAHQQVISAEIKSTFGEASSEKIREWNHLLDDFSLKSDELTHAVKRQVQRSSQYFSLNPLEEGVMITLEQQVLRLAQSNLLILQRLDNEIEESRYLLSLFERRSDWFKALWVRVYDWFDAPLFHVGTKPIQLSGLIKFFLIVLLTLWASRRLVNWFNQLAITRKRIEKSALYRLSRLFYYLLLTIGLIFALTTLGFDFSNFLLIAGALGVGLGFGLQTIFNNFISGLILLFESHIKVGDFIEIASGVRGEVKEIHVRSTIIQMNDGLEAIVPNSEIISNRVVNWTLAHPYRRITVPFTVAYGSDKELVRKIIIEAALKVPETLIKPGFSDPSVILNALGNAGMDFELHVWVNEKYSKLPGRSVSEYLWVIEDTLKQYKIDIPFPRTDIRLI